MKGFNQICPDSTSTHHFSSTHYLNKKASKPPKSAPNDKQAPPSSSSAAKATASNDDPFDFTALEADIAAVLERLKADLAKLRAGGRFNPEVLENLRVQPDKSDKQTVKLSDLAQVIPKGRVVNVLVGEKEVLPSTTPSICMCCEPQANVTTYSI